MLGLGHEGLGVGLGVMAGIKKLASGSYCWGRDWVQTKV